MLRGIKKSSAAAQQLCWGTWSASHKRDTEAVPGSSAGEDHWFLHFARKGAAPGARFLSVLCPEAGQEAADHCHEEIASWSWMLAINFCLAFTVKAGAGLYTPHPDGASLEAQRVQPSLKEHDFR